MASIFKQKYTSKDKAGNKITKRTTCYYIDYKAADGTRKRVKGFKDKTATRQLADKLEREAALAEVGIVDKYAEHRGRPLTEHIEDFRQSLLAKSGTAKHVRHTTNSVLRICQACKFSRWDDISASRIGQFLAGLRQGPNGISARTFNFDLGAMKQFCKWMIQDQRAPESPIAHLKRLNEKTDRRHDRRPLEVEEVRRLLEATRTARGRFGMTGPQRAMLYRLAVETGLRANELRTLTVSSFAFDKRELTVRAAYSKRKREDVLPLRPDTAAELKTFFQDKRPKAQAFNVPEKTADMLKADLSDAGIPYVDDSERYADFHALRHTTGSWLAANGVSPKVAQAIMRHSDINLTMGVYTHLLGGQEAEAVAKLPDLSLPSPEAQSSVATGTDGGTTIALFTKTSDSSRNHLATNGTAPRERKSKKGPAKDNAKPSKKKKLDTDSPLPSLDGIGEKVNGRYRARTCDPLIKSQPITARNPLSHNDVTSSLGAPLGARSPGAPVPSGPDPVTTSIQCPQCLFPASRAKPLPH